MTLHKRVAAATALALLLAGCGGGGGGGAVPGGGGSPGGNGGSPTGGGTGNVEFTISIPPSSGSSSNGQRSPQYISPNTLAGSVSVNSGTPQYFQLDIAANPTNCYTNGSGYKECTIVVQAPAGNDSFAWNLYDAAATPVGCNLGTATPCTGDSGHILSTFTGNDNVVAGTTNNLGTFTLNPVIASFTLGFTPTLVAGTPSTGWTVTLTAKDASGATIVAPGSYVNSSGTLAPVTLTSSLQGLPSPFNSISTTSGAISFVSDGGTPAATGVFNKPGDTVTVDYGGLAIPSWTLTGSCTPTCTATNQTVTLGATLGAATVGSVCNDSYDSCTTGTTSVAGTASFTGVYTADYATLTPSEVGWTNSPYNQQFTESTVSTTCGTGGSAIVTGNPGSGLASSFTINAKNAGSCSATYEDSTYLGQIVTMDFTTTTSSGGIQ